MLQLCKVTVAMMTAAFAVSAFAQANTKAIDFGKRQFEANCASCHGVNGKGNGPITDLLKKSPPDLSLLAKNNGE